MSITTRQARADEIDWINERYAEVAFKPSDYDREYIVIVEYDGSPAGIGRLVQIDEHHCELGGIYAFPEYRGKGVARAIVSSLLEQNPYNGATIWCLPFENLTGFYQGFGFREDETITPPAEVAKKLAWCNEDGRYEQRAVLLVM